MRIALSMYPGLEGRALRPEHRERLAELGVVLEGRSINDLPAERVDEVLGQTDVLLAHWGCLPVDAELLARAPGLRMVAYAAGTVKDTVAPEVFERGIVVTSGAAANAVPVAEFTLAAVLFAGKDVFGARERQRTDADPAFPWVSSRRPVGNLGKRIGLIGASHVGRAVIELLEPFRLEVLLADPYVDEATAASLGARLVSLEELLTTSDVVSIHAPALPETHHLIGATELAAMPDGSTLINTARGSLLDHEALARELRTGRLRAVLDVTDPEPLPADHELLRLPNAYVHPAPRRLAGDRADPDGRARAGGDPALRRRGAPVAPGDRA